VTLQYTIQEVIGVVLAWMWTSNPILQNYIAVFALVLCAELWMLTIWKEMTQKVFIKEVIVLASIRRVGAAVSLQRGIATTK